MVSKATVVFGGPSAEHDISILTGLQAERVLSGAGVEVQCVYWARAATTGSWCPNNAEARDFLGGEPSGSKRLELRIGAEKGGGFYLKGGIGGAKRLETGVLMNCFHGGAGESGGAQALFELAGLKATGGTVAAAALGMDKLAFGGGDGVRRRPVPAARAAVGAPRPSFDGPYIVKPRFGGSSIGIEVVEDWETAAALLTTSPHLRAGRRRGAEPPRALRPQRLGAHRARARGVARSSGRCGPRAAKIYSYAAKYLHTEGLASAPRGVPRRHLAGAARARSATWPHGSSSSPA